ncbi:MAG: hypothetical protein R3F60_00630 [bacterium]
MKYFLCLFCLLPACDEVISVRNAPPEVTITGLCQEGDRAYFLATVRDLEGQPVDVDLVVSLGGRTVVIGVGGAGDGATGLASSEEGIEHRIEWAQACLDGGCVDACAQQRVGPSRITACEPAPAPLGSAFEVTVHATDGEAVSTAQASVAVSSPCP